MFSHGYPTIPLSSEIAISDWSGCTEMKTLLTDVFPQLHVDASTMHEKISSCWTLPAKLAAFLSQLPSQKIAYIYIAIYHRACLL